MDLTSTQPSPSEPLDVAELLAVYPSPVDQLDVDELLGALWLKLDQVPDPLHRLHLLRTALHGVTGEVARTVDACREVAVTWELIADATGCNSKQAAQARYR
jgi:hypothetical protein